MKHYIAIVCLLFCVQLICAMNLEPIYQPIRTSPLSEDEQIRIRLQGVLEEEKTQNKNQQAKKATPLDQLSKLLNALRNKKIEKVAHIFEENPDIIYENLTLGYNNAPHLTPLHLAATHGYGVRFLVQKYQERATLFSPASKYINQVNYDGYTPLALACVNGHLDVVKFLLEQASANPHATRPHVLGLDVSDGPDTMEPIMQVLSTKHVPVLAYLLHSTYCRFDNTKCYYYHHNDLHNALNIYTNNKRLISIPMLTYIIKLSFDKYNFLHESCKRQLNLWHKKAPTYKKELLYLALKGKLPEVHTKILEKWLIKNSL